MVGLSGRSALVVLFTALTAGCLGGQTGQPSGLDCTLAELPPGTSWRGTTVEGAAEVFADSYEARLLWYEQPPSVAGSAPIEFPDSLRLTIAYGGTPATSSDCDAALLVPVAVTLSSRQSDIAETGDATLRVAGSEAGLTGTLHYESDRLNLQLELVEATPASRLRSGRIEARDLTLPGAFASVTEEEP